MCFALATAAGAAAEAPYSGQRAREYQSKAQYIYNFLFFVEWPVPKTGENASDKEALTIGILGEDPFGDSFNGVEGKPIGCSGRTLRIKRLGPYTNKLDVESCDVVFVCRSEYGRVEAVFERLAGRPVLTVADWPDFLPTGGMIELVQMKEKLRWRINCLPARCAGLRLNGQLLRNAVAVIAVPPQNDRRDEEDREPDDAGGRGGGSSGKAPTP